MCRDSIICICNEYKFKRRMPKQQKLQKFSLIAQYFFFLHQRHFCFAGTLLSLMGFSVNGKIVGVQLVPHHRKCDLLTYWRAKCLAFFSSTVVQQIATWLKEAIDCSVTLQTAAEHKPSACMRKIVAN